MKRVVPPPDVLRKYLAHCDPANAPAVPSRAANQVNPEPFGMRNCATRPAANPKSA